MKDAEEMTLAELLDETGMTLYEAIAHYCYDNQRFIDLIHIAHDKERGSVTHEAAIGNLMITLLGDRLRAEVREMEPPEPMRGNFAYDAIAKDRASGY